MLDFFVSTFFLILWLVLIYGFLSTAIFYYVSFKYPCLKLPAPPLSVFFKLSLSASSDLVWSLYSRIVGLKIKFLMSSSSNFNQNNQPIIFIHGIFLNNGAWKVFSPALEKIGYTTYGHTYSSFCGNLDSFIEDLDLAINIVRGNHPGKKPILVGYSFGGVIANLWLNKDNSNKIAGLISIGSPFNGSLLASSIFGPTAKLLKYNSPHFAKFTNFNPVNNLNCTAIVSPADCIVLPAESLLPPSGWKTIVIDPSQHLGLVRNATVLALLLKEIESMESGS